MSEKLFDYLENLWEQDSATRLCLSLIAHDFTVVRDFGVLDSKNPTAFFGPIDRTYDPSMHAISEVRINVRAYCEEHAFGDLMFIAYREPQESLDELAPQGYLHWQDRTLRWWEKQEHLGDWIETLRMFEPDKQNFTLLICLERGQAYWEFTHIKTQVGSSIFAQNILAQIKSN